MLLDVTYKVLIIDIDNTICITEGLEYENSKPLYERIKCINELYDAGAYIIYWTARGTNSKIDYSELTRKQLNSWSCKYHELQFNKPFYDLFICDKAIEANTFFNDENNIRTL